MPSALSCLWQGFVLLRKPGLRRFVLVPLAANVLVYSLALWISGRYFADLVNWLLPGWLDFLRWLLWPLFGLSFLLLMFFSFTLLANLIGSPFYGALAEKLLATEEGGRGLPVQAVSPWQGFFSELRRLRYYGIRAALLLVLFVIPGVNLVAPFLWLGFNAWFLALEYLAYPLEARGLPFSGQLRALRSVRLDALSFGGLVQVLLAVPLVNVVVPPAAVLGAGLYVKRRLRD